MGIEIERAFLVKDNRWEHLRTDHSRILQYGYLPEQNDDGITLRSSVCVRHITTVHGAEGRINIKSITGSKMRRVEHEIRAIDPKQTLDIINELCPHRLIKVRHFVGRWEIDEFLGRLSGLVIAEIEFREGENVNIQKPEWIGREITNSSEYMNENLAMLSKPPKKK